jgi:phage RecT family recombinase
MTTAVQTYLAPADVASLLADARTTHLEIVKHMPTKIRVDYMREVEFAKAVILRGPSAESLRKCHPKSLLAAFVNSASLGLTLNPIKKHCTIIARWNESAQEMEAQNLIMFQGLTFLATQSGVRDIVVDVVYSGDKFTMARTQLGDTYNHEINFTIDRGSEGNTFLGVYVAAKMPGSDFPKVEWIPAKDIYQMRDKSDSYLDKQNKPRASSPWVGWFDEMAKKSGIKRAQKRWEELVEGNAQWDVFKKAVDTDNAQEGVIPRRDSDIELKPEVETISLEQAVAVEAAAKEADMKPTKLLDAYKVTTLKDIPASSFEEVMGRIKAFGDAKKAKLAKGKK